jgi:hypothetical protein
MSKHCLASGLAWIGGIFALLLAFTPGDAWAACYVKAEDPVLRRVAGQLTIIGVGKRGPDCKEKKIVFVRLRHHKRLWFDETLAEVRFTITNANLRVRYNCNGAGTKTVFTEAWVQGDTKSKSRYKEFDACG